MKEVYLIEQRIYGSNGWSCFMVVASGEQAAIKVKRFNEQEIANQSVGQMRLEYRCRPVPMSL